MANCTQAELTNAKMAIRRRYGCDSYYVGSHERPQAAGMRVVHEFVLDDPGTTAYVSFVQAEAHIMLAERGPAGA